MKKLIILFSIICLFSSCLVVHPLLTYSGAYNRAYSQSTPYPFYYPRYSQKVKSYKHLKPIKFKK